MRIALPLLIVTVLIGGRGDPVAPRETAPVSVFADLDGTWSGTFVGYDAVGNELYRIKATHVYDTTSATEQTVQIRDVMPDGTVITGQGINDARRADDGSLKLRCLVRKSNGEMIDHEGRIARGPDGDQQIIWYSDGPQRVETFREVVRQEGDAFIYEINGMGRYGDSLILMAGRYQKIQDQRSTKGKSS